MAANELNDKQRTLKEKESSQKLFASEGQNSLPQASRFSPSMSPKRTGAYGENTENTDDLTTDKNGSPSDTLGRGLTIASKSLKAAAGSSTSNNERSNKKTTTKKAGDEKSVLTQAFYKDAFIVRYNDEGEISTRIFGEPDFQHEFLRRRPTEAYWSTLTSI